MGSPVAVANATCTPIVEREPYLFVEEMKRPIHNIEESKNEVAEFVNPNTFDSNENENLVQQDEIFNDENVGIGANEEDFELDNFAENSNPIHSVIASPNLPQPHTNFKYFMHIIQALLPYQMKILMKTKKLNQHQIDSLCALSVWKLYQMSHLRFIL